MLVSKSNKILSWIIITSVSYVLVAILILHLLRPDKNPVVNAISEYAIGPYGALMTSVFFVQSVGSFALALFLMSIKPRKRKILFGAFLFILAALGDVIAGLFLADPISSESMTSTGLIHTIGGMTRFVSLAVALPLLSPALTRNQLWSKQGNFLKALGWLFLIAFIGTIFFLVPVSLFGLGQRVFIGTVLMWMFFVALPIVKASNM